MVGRQITQRSILRVLILGVGSVIILLVVAGFIGVQNVRSIKQTVAGLVQQQNLTSKLISGLQREQQTLNAVFFDMAQDPDALDAESILDQVSDSDKAISALVKEAHGTPDEKTWLALQQAASAFSAEVRRILSFDQPESFSSFDLLRRHTDVVAITSRLLASSYQRASEAQAQIERTSSKLVKQSALLLGSSLVFSLFFAIWTVRMTADLFREMEWQTGELSRVSWHMLENQETTARRFSHELHDELGQSLTAVKANLLAIPVASSDDRDRLNDARRLIDEAIRNVRELSQLLRPTILDDLGLDAALRSLAEGFTHRTGIEVDYSSNFHDRLSDETETHLFRIAQEALTNVVRHANATRVVVLLNAESGALELCVEDNGKGIPSAQVNENGLGMIGMRARARSMGGELHVGTPKNGGVRVDVRVPLRSERLVNDTHLVS